MSLLVFKYLEVCKQFWGYFLLVMYTQLQLHKETVFSFPQWILCECMVVNTVMPYVTSVHTIFSVPYLGLLS